jgi:hypothetical protein
MLHSLLYQCNHHAGGSIQSRMTTGGHFYHFGQCVTRSGLFELPTLHPTLLNQLRYFHKSQQFFGVFRIVFAMTCTRRSMSSAMFQSQDILTLSQLQYMQQGSTNRTRRKEGRNTDQEGLDSKRRQDLGKSGNVAFIRDFRRYRRSSIPTSNASLASNIHVQSLVQHRHVS